MGSEPRDASAGTSATASAPTPAPALETVTLRYALSRGSCVEVARRLPAIVDGTQGRADTPVRLAAALQALVDRAGGHGTVGVRRVPGALQTPEYWHVVVRDADGACRAALDNALAVERR